MEEKAVQVNQVSHSAVISACERMRSGSGRSAFLAEMQKLVVQAERISYNAANRACVKVPSGRGRSAS